MAEELNPSMRTISVRRDGTALVPINALVSRGCQDVAALVALGSDTLVAGIGTVTAVEGEVGRAGSLSQVISKEIATFIDEHPSSTTFTGIQDAHRMGSARILREERKQITRLASQFLSSTQRDS